MNDFQINYGIEELIKSTVKAVDMEIEIRKDNSGINMSYNFIGNYIGVDMNRLLIAKSEMPALISLELYVKILTIHELGHAIDRNALMSTLDRTIEIYNIKQTHTLKELYNDVNLLEILLEEHEMNLSFEQTAWSNAEKLNQIYNIVEPMYFEKVKKHSLSTYTDSYQADQSLYNLLIEETSEQIA
ncbi:MULTISPECIES: integrase [Psychrobacillus]|uniref:Integrase n=1 Tax=Psychrobacillus faecigallinarum TaxID=2762235 RepID=A0ABR8R7L5_9BACI|nr:MULTISPECIES: integrase [Psychrobacillus]MBD7943694.1 integrase [Psychrobacillus faecigallinarum]